MPWPVVHHKVWWRSPPAQGRLESGGRIVGSSVVWEVALRGLGSTNEACTFRYLFTPKGVRDALKLYLWLAPIFL